MPYQALPGFLAIIGESDYYYMQLWKLMDEDIDEKL
jgi:hypothetical protein